MRGFFITIYGVNNIGKSTHARLLTRHLRAEGCDAFYIKYPVYDLEPTGPEINRILRANGDQKISEEDLQKLFMQNRRDYEPTLRKMLENGKTVIAEDYTGTGLAWGNAKSLPLEFLEKLNAGLLREDLAILITGERDTRAEEKKHIHEQNPQLIDKVGSVLLELAKKYDWKIVELRPRIEDTAVAVSEIVHNFLKANNPPKGL